MQIYHNAISHEYVPLLVATLSTPVSTVQTGKYTKTHSIYSKHSGLECNQHLHYRHEMILIFVIKMSEHIFVSLCALSK